MTINNVSKSVARPTIAANTSKGRLAPFGPSPLIEGEDPASYDDHFARISAALRPTDILEEILVRDVVDLDWDVIRVRRLKAHLLSSSAYKGLIEVLRPLICSDDDFLDKNIEGLALAWVRRDPSAIKEVDEILASADLTMDAVMAHTLSQNLHAIERFEHMIAMAESRRNAILRELDRHRADHAQGRRRPPPQIEDGECQVIDSEPTAPKN
jgi:hypothetical protein